LPVEVDRFRQRHLMQTRRLTLPFSDCRPARPVVASLAAG
jgi:hypothetical protein